jgi:hypothetical protein
MGLAKTLKEGGTPRISLLIVTGAMLLHVALHCATIDSLLPHGKEPGAALVHQALSMRGEVPQADSAWAKYPHVVSRLMTLMPWAPTLTLSPGIEPKAELEAHLTFASRHFVVARLVVILLTALAIPLSYLLARRFLSPPWDLVATLLLASSLLLQCFAHQARPHAALVAPALAALLGCQAWARSGRHRDLALATLGCSLALGTLHSGAFVLIGALTALIVRLRSPSRLRWGPPLLAIGVLVLAVRLTYPFLFDEPQVGSQFSSTFGTYAFPHIVTRERFTGDGFAVLAATVRSYDPALGIAAVIGLLALALRWWPGWRRRSDLELKTEPAATVVLVLPALVYFLVVGLYGRTFERFLMPLLPFLAVLAAFGLATCASGIGSLLGAHARRFATLALITGTLMFTTWPCLRLVWLHGRPDTYQEAAQWVTENVDREGELALIVPLVNLPLLLPIVREEGYLAADSPLKLLWTQYLAELPEGALHSPLAPILPIGPGGRLPLSLEEYPTTMRQVLEILRDLEGDYLILERGSATGRGVNTAAEQRGKLVKPFSPWANEKRSGHGLTFSSDTFRTDVLAARCLGLVLEIWKID